MRDDGHRDDVSSAGQDPPVDDRQPDAPATTTTGEPVPSPAPPFAPPARRASRAALRRVAVIGGAVLLVGLGYLAAASALGDSVAPGTSVSGIAVGGVDREEAARRLGAGLAVLGTAPFTVQVVAQDDAEDAPGFSATLDPVSAGLSVDVPATVDLVTGHRWDPRRLWAQLSGGGGAHPPVVRVDDARLGAALAALAARVDRDPVDGGVSFAAGLPIARPALTGRRLMRAESAKVLRTAWLTSTDAVNLVVQRRRPVVDSAAVEHAMGSFAVPSTSGPLVVAVGARKVAVPPQRFAAALSMVAVGPRLSPRVDAAALRRAALATDPALERAAVDARIVLRAGVPTVLPSQDGAVLDAGALARDVLPALARADRTVHAVLKPQTPALTTQQANALGVREVISTFSTNLTADARRTANIRIAARTINDHLVRPGETFSLNQTLGVRTPGKGYIRAPVIEYGRLTEDFGGGVSQLATTMYNAVFFAGLADVQHKPHSFYISRYPEGREATVAWPSVDLKWRNDSGHGVLVRAAVRANQVTVTFYGTRRWGIRAEKGPRRNIRTPRTLYDPSRGCVGQSAIPGFDVTVTRVFLQNGHVVRRQPFKVRYNASNHVVCAPAPAPAPAPGPVPSSGPVPTPASPGSPAPTTSTR